MKKVLTKSLSLFSVLLITVVLASCDDEKQIVSTTSAADLVLRGGAVYTVDEKRSWAEAVAISAGKIVFVGSDEEIGAFIGADTKLIELDGRMLLPSFQDSHIHPMSGGMESMAVNLNGQASVDEYISTIRQYAESHPDEPWLLGGGWSMAMFGSGALAGRDLIDEVVADRPVYLTSADGHTGWANSKALELAGIDKNTPDPLSGRIDRDPETGEAIGSLQEGAMDLVTKHIPAPSSETRSAGLRYAINMLNEYGITAIQDAIVRRAELEIYRAMDQRGELSLRVTGSIWWDRDKGLEQIADMKQLREEFSDGSISATTVKIMQDGVMENFTAAMLEPYVGQGDNKGIPMVEPEALKMAVAALDAEGFQVHFHAIGDAAIRHCLDAVEFARAQNGNLGHRHHISHLQLIDPNDIPRFAELEVVANFQAQWAFADPYITDLTLPFIGEERGRWLYPIASVQQHGGKIAFGSDWSVSTANPFHQIETAVTRKDAIADSDIVFIAEERIDLDTTLAAFTINAAFVNKIENITGSIEIGKAADLIVLDRNLFDIAKEEISETRVLLTLLNGKAVHGSPDNL